MLPKKQRKTAKKLVKDIKILLKVKKKKKTIWLWTLQNSLKREKKNNIIEQEKALYYNYDLLLF